MPLCCGPAYDLRLQLLQHRWMHCATFAFCHQPRTRGGKGDMDSRKHILSFGCSNRRRSSCFRSPFFFLMVALHHLYTLSAVRPAPPMYQSYFVFRFLKSSDWSRVERLFLDRKMLMHVLLPLLARRSRSRNYFPSKCGCFTSTCGYSSAVSPLTSCLKLELMLNNVASVVK